MGKIDVPTNMVELLGAPGSVLSDIYQGGESHQRQKGNAWKGTEKILPRAGGSVMQAIREKTERVTTKHEAPGFFGREQLKGDGVDTLIHKYHSLKPEHY